jgi:hypothetical protein
MLQSLLRTQLTAGELAIAEPVLAIPSNLFDAARTTSKWVDSCFTVQVVARNDRCCPFMMALCRPAPLHFSWGIGDRNPTAFVGGITHEDIGKPEFFAWVRAELTRFLRARVQRRIRHDAAGRAVDQRYELYDPEPGSQPFEVYDYRHKWRLPWAKLTTRTVEYEPWLPSTR